MLVLMSTYSSSELEKEEYDFAVFKMEVNEAKLIAQKLNLFKIMRSSDPSLLSMRFNVQHTDLQCEFFPGEVWTSSPEEDYTAKAEEELDKKGWTVVEHLNPDITPMDAHLPDCLYLVIEEDGFYWKAYPTASNLIIETQLVPNDVLARVL